MLINRVKRDGTTVLQHMEVGSNLTGVRITSIVFEGPREIRKLASEQGRDWLARTVAYCFLPDNKQ